MKEDRAVFVITAHGSALEYKIPELFVFARPLAYGDALNSQFRGIFIFLEVVSAGGF